MSVACSGRRAKLRLMENGDLSEYEGRIEDLYMRMWPEAFVCFFGDRFSGSGFYCGCGRDFSALHPMRSVAPLAVNLTR